MHYTKIPSDFNCKFPFPFKTRKHHITISYSQLILHRSLQKSHSGQSHRSATWLWEHTGHSHASQPAQGTEGPEESIPYSTRTARTGRQVRQRVKRCGGLAWRLRWCTPRHLENFSTKRFGGSLELGHRLPEHDRRNTLPGEAHWRYWVTFWMNIGKAGSHQKEFPPKGLNWCLLSLAEASKQHSDNEQQWKPTGLE